jgi:hypothetical protein
MVFFGHGNVNLRLLYGQLLLATAYLEWSYRSVIPTFAAGLLNGELSVIRTESNHFSSFWITSNIKDIRPWSAYWCIDQLQTDW